MTPAPRNTWRSGVIVGAMLWAAPALAQAPADAPAPMARAAVDLDGVLSRQIARVALMDLRAAAAPQTGDYGVATLLLDLAAKYSPDNVELARRRAEAAWNWGDATELDLATRRIIQLDPRDTMAQLRLISSRFDSLQTVEDKVAAYDRIGDSKDLDPSIRSRFLLDAALLEREQGDESGFVKRLARSIELDSSNKEAAVLALTYFEQRSDDRWGRLDLITNLLLADPLDPNVHARLVQEFASGGAYTASRRFMDNVTALSRSDGQGLPPADALKSLVLDVLCDGPAQTLADLNEQVTRAREALQRQLKMLEDAKQPTTGLPKPEDIRLDLDHEGVRIVCMLLLKDDPAGAVRELGLTAQDYATKILDALQRPADMTDEEAADNARAAFARVELWRLALGIDLDKVDADLARACDGAPEADPEACAVKAIVAARAGDFDKVPELLASASGDEPWLYVAKGLSAELSGDIPGAIALYMQGREGNPLLTQGVLAGILADRARAVHSIPAPPEAQAVRRRLEEYSGNIDAWIDSMVRDPRTFEYIEATLDQPDAEVLAPAQASLKILNRASRPMALGAGKPINSRLLIAQSVEAGGRSLTIMASAEFVDAQRRLRLMPGETLTIKYALDTGPTGWLLETLSGVSGRIRLRMVQGFVIRPNGAREPGPGCLETMSASFDRRPLPEARLSATDIAAQIATRAEDSLPTLLVAARGILVLPPPEGSQPVIDALVQRYPALSPRLRCMLLATIPNAAELPELTPLDNVVDSERDPEVLGLALVTRAVDAKSPLILAGLESADPRLARLAQLHQERIAADTKCYALKGSGLVRPLRTLFGVDVPQTAPTASGDPGASPALPPAAAPR